MPHQRPSTFRSLRSPCRGHLTKGARPLALSFGVGALTASVIASGLSTSCVTAPVTNRHGLALVPDSQMSALGTQAYAEMREKTPSSPDKALEARVVEVGRRIARASGADYDWEFTLFQDDKTVNAFCLPGGKIGVYTGILPIAKTDAGLAAILGHEVAHATAHHAQERVSQGLVAETGLTIASLTLGDSAYRQPVLAALGMGAQVGVLLPFSRRHESEADTIGLHYMAKAGYDPREAVELWKRMAAEEKGNPPEFLSTHPASASRVAALQSQVDSVLPLYASSEKQGSSLLR